MPTIIVQPSGIRIEAATNDTVMGAANASGYYWPTTCGGECRCTTCAITVISGAENLSELGRAESKTLMQERGPKAIASGMRLACQARVQGDIEVHKPGVRPASL
jgi:2Fe-2S ferredoxin